MLAQAVALVVRADLQKVGREVLSTDAFEAEPAQKSGRIDPANPSAGLASALLPTGEAQNLVYASPGDEFNLSAAEFAKVSASTTPQQAAEAYRAVLVERFDAYVKQGLSGIAPYDRGSGDRSSAAEDIAAMTKASPVMATYLGALSDYLREFPHAKLPGNMQESFRWVQRSVQDRPTMILLHRVEGSGPNGRAVFEREFYVGHSYNASQSIAAALPSQAGTVLFLLSASTTDQVAGFMSGPRHAVGRSMLRDVMVERFEQIRAEFGR
jgi:hypothetical protein